jgi:CubicO group peptidase (beta-lactamase class C family)
MGEFDLGRLERIGEALDADVARGTIPGTVVLVALDGKLAYERANGFRNRPAADPMRLDTIFRGASMTKPVVAVAALMLVEEGKLQLWDPVATYLPELAGVRVGIEREPPSRPMTVQDLFRHTAGFTYGPFGSTEVHAAYREANIADPADTNEVMVRKLATVPLLYHPGTMFEYGMSIDVLGRVVEVVDGRELDASLEARIFGPLGMRDTGFRLPPEKRERLAEPHLSAAGANPLKFLYDPDAPPRFFSGVDASWRGRSRRRPAPRAQDGCADDEQPSAARLRLRFVHAHARHHRAAPRVRPRLRPRRERAHRSRP